MSAVASQLADGYKIAWQPQAGPQERLITCPIFDVLYGGARGGGKTDGLLGDFIFHADQYAQHAKGIIFRKTMPEFEEIISRSKEIYYQLGAKFKEHKKTWIFPNGATLKLRYLKRESDAELYQGHSYTWLAIDEMGGFATPKYIDMLRATLRSGQAVPVFFRASCNPGGPGHNWIKARYVTRAPYGTPFYDPEIKDYRVFIPSKVDDNRILLQGDPGYKDRVRSAARAKGEYLVKAWLDGSWDIVAGGMFDDVWNENIHIIKPFNVPLEWKMDRSFDWGSSKPFSVGWWAESDGSDYQDAAGDWCSSVRGDLFRVQEWYGWSGEENEGRNMLAVDVAKGIVERELAWGWRRKNYCRIKAGPADSSIFTLENGNDISADMAQSVRIGSLRYNGVNWLEADKRPGSRKIGWEAVRKMMMQAIPKDNLPREKPGIFVFDHCTQFRRTVPVLPRDPDNTDDVNTKSEDHIGDETRYRVRMAGTSGKVGTTVGLY